MTVRLEIFEAMIKSILTYGKGEYISNGL
jgi:hypothetical protein